MPNLLIQLRIDSAISDAKLKKQRECSHANMQVIELLDFEHDRSVSIRYCPNCQYEE